MSDFQERIFKYASRFAKRSEKDGKGTQWPTLRQVSKRFNCKQQNIVDAIESYSGSNYLGLGVGELIHGGVYTYSSPGKWVVEAY